MVRTEVNPAEIADEMEKERRFYQLQTCEYLLKYKEIKTKTGIELLQHFIEYYHALNNYFKDGLKTIAHFGTYIDDLSVKLQTIKQKQDDERKKLLELRTLLRSTPEFEQQRGIDNITSSTDKSGSSGVGGIGGGSGGASSAGCSAAAVGAYSLYQLQGDKHHGITRSGHLLKKVKVKYEEFGKNVAVE